MTMTSLELLETLNLTGMGASRAVNDFSQREVPLSTAYNIYRECVGDDAPDVPDALIHTVVGYLINAAVKGEPLNADDALSRAEVLRAKLPGSFSDASLRERMALRAAEGKVKPVAGDEPPSGGTPIAVDPNAPKRGRGRPKGDNKSAYEQATDLWRSAVDRSKTGFIAFLQAELGLGYGSAQTYYYKAKKEIVLDA